VNFRNDPGPINYSRADNFPADWNRCSGSHISPHQNPQMMQQYDHSPHYNQSRMGMHKADDVPESSSSNMCRLFDSANMGGKISVSHLYESALTDKVFASYACNGDKEWIIDTGASNHMISHKEMLNFKKPVTAYHKQVYLPNGGTVEVSHIGSCDLMDGRSVKNVLYIPDFRYNLLSVSKITKELQCSVQFFPDCCVFQDLSSGKVLEIGEEKDGLYLMNHKRNDTDYSLKGMVATKNKMDILLWHKRMGHASVGTMTHLFNIDSTECKRVLDRCDVCPLA